MITNFDGMNPGEIHEYYDTFSDDELIERWLEEGGEDVTPFTDSHRTLGIVLYDRDLLFQDIEEPDDLICSEYGLLN